MYNNLPIVSVTSEKIFKICEKYILFLGEKMAALENYFSKKSS